MENLRTLKETYGLSGDIDIGLVANMPDVMRTVPEVEDEEQVSLAMENAVAAAAAKLDEMREREGRKLSEDLLMRGELVRETVSGSAGSGTLRATSLNHEVGYDTMEYQPIVERFARILDIEHSLGEADEVHYSHRSLLMLQTQCDITLFGMDDGIQAILHSFLVHFSFP